MSFDFAWSLSEQLITLSTLVLGFTATFAKEFRADGKGYITSISIAWTLYLISILFGLLTFMAIVGTLDGSGIYVIPTNAKWYTGLQMVSFGIASIMIAITGWRVYRTP